jgi:hypothetical protein
MTVPDWGRRMLGVSFTPPEEFCPSGLSDLLPYVQLAEELGFGQVAVGDHVVITANRENYPPEAFHSETASFDQLWCLPPPARPGGPIVLLAGPAKPVAARRVARLGDGWAPFPIGPEAARAGIAVMREAYKEAGRDPDTLRVRVSVNGNDEGGRVDVEAAFDKVRGLWDAGVQMVAMVAPSFLDDRRDLRDFLRHAADRLLRADRSAVPDG